MRGYAATRVVMHGNFTFSTIVSTKLLPGLVVPLSVWVNREGVVSKARISVGWRPRWVGVQCI